MKQRKSILLTALAVLLVFGLVFAGCSDGSSSKTSNTPDPVDQVDPVEPFVLYEDGKLTVKGDFEVIDDGDGFEILLDDPFDVSVGYSKIIFQLTAKGALGTDYGYWIGGQIGLAEEGVGEEEGEFSGLGFWTDDYYDYASGVLTFVFSKGNTEDLVGDFKEFNEIVVKGGSDNVSKVVKIHLE